MADIEDHLEFREVETKDGADADEWVYFLGVHVHTIKDVWTRPGGHVYVEKEQCLKRAERAIKRLWAETEGTR